MLYWDKLRPKSVLDVFNPELPTIVDIEIQIGEMGINALMVKWMNSFLQFYSTNGTMDAIQVSDTINLIRETYANYTQEDFKLFFNMAKKGMFGQIFGRIDGEVIMNWLAKYDIHRDTVAQSESIKEAEKYKALVKLETDGIYYSDYLKLKARAASGDKEAIEMLKPPSK
ncbi:MAG: hypothetical protein RR220_07940 [Bacteroidaceae bacterium]